MKTGIGSAIAARNPATRKWSTFRDIIAGVRLLVALFERPFRLPSVTLHVVERDVRDRRSIVRGQGANSHLGESGSD